MKEVLMTDKDYEAYKQWRAAQEAMEKIEHDMRNVLKVEKARRAQAGTCNLQGRIY